MSVDALQNRVNIEDDDDVPRLSAEALQALKEFYAESAAQEKSLDENWVTLIL